MKFIQKLLSHGLLIGFFVAVFFLYLYRVQLFPQWFGDEEPALAQTETMLGENAVTPDSSSSSAMDTESVEQPWANSSASVVEPHDAKPATPDGNDLPPLEEQPAAEPTSPPPDDATPLQPDPVEQPQVQSEAGAADIPPTIEEAASETAPFADQTALVVEQQSDTAQQPEAAAVQPPAEHEEALRVAVAPASDQPHDEAYNSQLNAARGQFWNNNLRAAEAAYRQLVSAYPARADAWGELGNLYFNLGRWEQAAQAYHQAIGLMIDQGLTGRARQMLRVMYGLDSAKASELEKRLAQQNDR